MRADPRAEATGVATGGTAPDLEITETPPPPTRRRSWTWFRRVLAAAVLVFALVAAISRRHELGQAFNLFGRIRWQWLLIAVGFEVASLIAFARLQRLLLRAGGVEVGVGTMVEITLAGNALAMSLPGGAAWAAAWAFGQLRRRGAEPALAGWVVLMAGALASYALFLLLVVGALLAGAHGPAKQFRFVGLALACIPPAAGVLALAAHRSPRVRSTLGGAWQSMCRSWLGRRALPSVERFVERIKGVRHRPWQWAEAFGLALFNWLATCACLAAVIIALGGHVPWRAVLVAYTLAQVAASIPITPGGLGIVEGSLTALLVAYGMQTDLALASVLLFRVVSFWALVPVGWGAWGVLTLSGRRAPDRQPHPWAVHTHSEGTEPSPGGSRSAPHRLLDPPKCRGCA